MAPAGVGKSPPRRSRANASRLFYMKKLPRPISQPCPRRRGKTRDKATQARCSWPDFSRARFLKRAGALRWTEFEQRTGGLQLPENFRSDEPLPESATRLTSARPSKKISSFALPGKLCQREACRRCQKLNYQKALGAPVAWEKLKRSRPRKELEMTGELEMSQNRKPRNPNCHI